MNTILPLIIVIAIGIVVWFYLRSHQVDTQQTNQQVPAWATFFDSDKWDYFRKLMLDYFKTRGIEITYDETLGVIQDKEGRQLGLQNLAQLCSQNDQFEWSNLVTNHFDAVYKSFMESDEISKLIENYEQIEKILAVRIWPEASLADAGVDKIVYRKDVEGTITVLVYDLPTSVLNVKPEDVQKWGKSEKELFDKAIFNILAIFKPEITQEKLANGIQVWVFSGDSFYIASNILLLELFPNCIGQNGALVAIPHRHVMLCYPISTLEAVEAVKQLIPLVRYMEAQGPGSITPNLYWFHEGEFENLPYEVADKAIQFYPPDSFTKMLNTLSEK